MEIAGGVCMHVEKCIRYQRVQLLFEKKTLLHIIFNPQQLLSEKNDQALARMTSLSRYLHGPGLKINSFKPFLRQRKHVSPRSAFPTLLHRGAALLPGAPLPGRWDGLVSQTRGPRLALTSSAHRQGIDPGGRGLRGGGGGAVGGGGVG